MRGMIWMCLTLAMLGIAGCHHTPDEQRIRDTVVAMQAALEARDPRTFISHVSADFTGNDGQVAANGCHTLWRAKVLRKYAMGVPRGPIAGNFKGPRAPVRVTATFTGGSGGLLPERGSIYSITSGWKREGGEWRCYNAAWQQKL